MKKTFLFLLGISAALMASAEIRVLSDVKLGEGYFPRFADAETVTYLAAENARYVSTPVDINADLRVDNENLDLNLYRNGKLTVLKPHGDVNYIWSSLSPNKKYILFNTKCGTAVCDLEGNEIINFGNLNAPVWFGNDYVVGMNDMHDGYFITSSNIVIVSLDGVERELLTDNAEKAYFPNVDAATGRIVYNTDAGDIRMMQLNLTEQPIRQMMPRMVEKPSNNLIAEMERKAKKVATQEAAAYKIYINPGHGGYGSNDRNMAVYPFSSGDKNGFWESVSNLDKGLRLDTMLRALGFQTKLSRTTNNDGGGNDATVLKNWVSAGKITEEESQYMLTNGDDRSLSAIVAEADAYKADFMLSIHSNAGNPANYILQLYSGIDPGDNRKYNHMPAHSETSRKITTLMGDNQYLNQISCWTRQPRISGDKTFAKDIMGWSNGYGVLNWLDVPGTISEGMMHDYLPETYRLLNIDYKRQESFYFAKTFYTWFCGKQLPYGAIGGKLYDEYQKQIFPDYKPNKNSRDVYRPINKGLVELWQDGKKLASYTTDSLYNGCYFFWDLQPGTYVVKAQPDGYYPQEDTLVVEFDKISYAHFAMTAKRQSPLEVLAYSPHVELTDSQQVSVAITIDFNWDVREDSTTAAFSISPAVEGSVTYEEGGRRLRFTPAKRFEPGTEYTVTLGTGACHPDANFDNHLKTPLEFKFRTSLRGNLEVVQTYPENGSENIPVDAAFIAIFDGKLANSSNKYFKVYDAAGNDISPATRSVKLNEVAPAPYGSAKFELKAGSLKANSEYKMVIGAEVADVNGVIVNDPVTVTFKTGDKVTSSLDICNNLDSLFFEGDKETSVAVASVLTARNTASKYEGYASNKLTYTFSGVNGEAIYVADDVAAIQCNSVSRFGMYVFGDYSFNELYARWAVEGDIQYTKICDLNYAGWLYQEADLSALPAGVDYQFMGFKIVRGTSFLSEKGEVSIDLLCMKYQAPTALENIAVESVNTKTIENGYLNILFNGVKYNAEGKVIR